MNDEDIRLRSLYTREEAEKEDKFMKEEAKDLREKEMDEQWRKYLLDSEIEKQQLIQ